VDGVGGVNEIDGLLYIPDMTDEIVTGERLQSIAEIYIGVPALFLSNPNVDSSKCVDILTINAPFNNPRTVFFYPDVLGVFPSVIRFFKNPFVLITHNSDINIISHPLILFIANHPLVICWYAQNVCIRHPRVRPLPIGIANSQWGHGELSVFEPFVEGAVWLKEKDIYMNFSVNTSPLLREECKRVCESKGIVFLESVTFKEHIARLSKYKYCICPEGNGVDTHRLWECLYVKTIPIMLKTDFSMLMVEYYKLPVILVDSWESLKIELLQCMVKEESVQWENFNLSAIKNILKIL
jgi:hypothetical protein